MLANDLAVVMTRTGFYPRTSTNASLACYARQMDWLPQITSVFHYSREAAVATARRVGTRGASAL